MALFDNGLDESRTASFFMFFPASLVRYLASNTLYIIILFIKMQSNAAPNLLQVKDNSFCSFSLFIILTSSSSSPAAVNGVKLLLYLVHLRP